MNKFALAALAIAVEEIGKGEHGANNAGSDVEKYLNGLAEPPANWCAGFVCWCFYQAYQCPTYLDPPFDYTLSARNLYNQFRDSEKLEIVKEPGMADLMFFWRGDKNGWMGHVGIVEEVSNKFIHTIEGNRGKFPSKVSRQYYPVNGHIPQLLGYGRVK